MDKVLKSFIVFEGLDGAGTTTQIMNLARYYEFNRREYFLTREPTDNPIGQLVRQVLQKKVATTPEALALLYAADRHDHLFSESHGIARMAEEGRIVISDRYFYSSIAYQSVECDPGFIRLINAFPSPEFIIFVDTPVEECLARIEKRGEARELFDRGEFLTSVRENYIRAFSSLPEGVKLLTVDGAQPIDTVESEIRRWLSSFSL